MKLLRYLELSDQQLHNLFNEYIYTYYIYIYILVNGEWLQLSIWGGSINRGIQNGWFIRENQSINGWFGGTPISGKPYIVTDETTIKHH